MSDEKIQPVFEGVKPQVENIRGVTPQHQGGGLSPLQGGVQPQHTQETGQGVGAKPPASK